MSPGSRRARKRDWRYWQRHSQFLERRLSSDAIEAVDESTDGILGLLEDPARPGPWDRRGLVRRACAVGKDRQLHGTDLQGSRRRLQDRDRACGDCTTTCGSQTQIRLEEGFLGYERSVDREAGRVIGVGEIDNDPAITPNCLTTRADNGDFTTRAARNLAITPEQRPWLFVVKKQKTVLTQLLRWIRGHVADSVDASTGRSVVTALPLLVIDDESDHASVDTGEQAFDEEGRPDEEHEPKTINRLIRSILYSFTRAAYVGYTATPFANIFIHRRGFTAEEGAGPVPRSLHQHIGSTVPTMSGPARLFGVRTRDGRAGALPLARSVSDHVDDTGKHGWMPPNARPGHIPLWTGQEVIPPSLREALHAFVLACAVRQLRGQGAEHASMLVHVTRLTLVQGRVHHQVDDAVRQMRPAAHTVDRPRTAPETAAGTVGNLISSRPAPMWPTCWAWKDVPRFRRGATSSRCCRDIVSDIDVRTVNGTARDALDYAEAGRGLKVVAIGGDKLSRGLTLEGLCTSYFLRTTRMYDTLMQMGRWFGYRPGYVDLCRLYTTGEMVEWFGHIADASEELREEFEAMAETGSTPP